jgi:hypothetical protein
MRKLKTEEAEREAPLPSKEGVEKRGRARIHAGKSTPEMTP